MAKVAPRDGTVLHIIFQSMPSYQAMGGQGVEFDVRQFGWIGNTTDSPNVVNSWYTTGIKTIQDVMKRELVVGATGHRDDLLSLSGGDECARRHQVQDRHRLSGRQ